VRPNCSWEVLVTELIRLVAAGRPLAGLEGTVEEVVTRCDQRIDRPPRPERPLSGRLVSGTRGRTGVGGHAGVCVGLTPRTVSGRLPPAGHQRGHVVVPAVPTRTWATRAARSRTRYPGPLLRRPRPCASEVGMVGVRPAWPPQRPDRERSGAATDTAGRFRCGRPSAVQVPDTADGLPLGITRECGATGTGRRVGGRWWDAASAGEREPAGRPGGRGVDCGRRSSPAG
jgi:hypothetical protein